MSSFIYGNCEKDEVVYASLPQRTGGAVNRCIGDKRITSLEFIYGNINRR
jgi:hypothetical protein